MSKKIKMGRPKKLPGERKQMFAIRFTVDQLFAFEQAANAKKLTVREWVTSALTNAAK